MAIIESIQKRLVIWMMRRPAKTPADVRTSVRRCQASDSRAMESVFFATCIRC